MSKLENETIINYNEAERIAYINTFSKRTQENLTKLCEEFPDQYKKISEEQYTCDKKLVKLSRPRKLTDEQRKEMSNRMKMAREKLK